MDDKFLFELQAAIPEADFGVRVGVTPGESSYRQLEAWCKSGNPEKACHYTNVNYGGMYDSCKTLGSAIEECRKKLREIKRQDEQRGAAA